MSAEGAPKPFSSAVKKMFSFQGESHLLPLGSQSHDVGKKIVSAGSYHQIRKKDLGKIHKAACSGNVPEVQRLLLLRPERLNGRDRMKR